MKRKFSKIAFVTIISIIAASCYGGGSGGDSVHIATSWKVIETSVSPHLQFHHDFGPYPVIESGVANSCIETSTSVDGRQNYCRVLDGDEAIGDNRNWQITFPDIWSVPEAVSGSNGYGGDATHSAWGSPYGYTIVLPDGSSYEGCDKEDLYFTYWCDFRSRKPVVEDVTFDGSILGWKTVLLVMWRWSDYAASTLGCAGGIVGVVGAGNPITLPLLRGCVDGPL